MMSLKGEPLGAESLLQPNRNYDAGKSHFMPCANRIYVAKNSSRSRRWCPKLLKLLQFPEKSVKNFVRLSRGGEGGSLSVQQYFPVQVLYPGVQDAAGLYIHLGDGAAEIAAGAVHGAGA